MLIASWNGIRSYLTSTTVLVKYPSLLVAQLYFVFYDDFLIFSVPHHAVKPILSLYFIY